MIPIGASAARYELMNMSVAGGQDGFVHLTEAISNRS